MCYLTGAMFLTEYFWSFFSPSFFSGLFWFAAFSIFGFLFVLVFLTLFLFSSFSFVFIWMNLLGRGPFILLILYVLLCLCLNQFYYQKTKRFFLICKLYLYLYHSLFALNTLVCAQSRITGTHTCKHTRTRAYTGTHARTQKQHKQHKHIGEHTRTRTHTSSR